MKHPEEVSRLFSKPDEEVLQQSDVLLGSFQANKSLFIERFPDLADPFVNKWATSTSTARSILPDYASVAGQASETDEVEKLMDQGRTLFQTVMLYTKLAFPGNSTVMRLFGQSQYESARNSTLKLPQLLKTVFTQVSKPEYKPALMAKGLKDSEIDSLNTLSNSIINQNTTQQSAIKDRSLNASQRIIAMNAVWEKMALVCQCAKLVFQDDAAKYNLFLLTDGEGPKPDEPTTPPDGNK